jgi:signal transduction histidine kinase
MKQLTYDYAMRVCGGLNKLAEMVRTDTSEDVATNDHVALIKHYDQVRKLTDQIKEAREALDEMEKRLSREQVPEAMRAAGVKTITIEGVGRVSLSNRWSCSMLDKQLGFDYLRANGAEGLIIETVNSQTLAAYAKELSTEEGKELPADVFKTGIMTYTSITKA